MAKSNLSIHGSIDPILTKVGGVPPGAIIEFFGPESSGKTTLACLMVAKAQASGGKAAYIDMEYALDLDHAKFLGVNTDDLYYSQPESGEEAFEEICKLCEEKYDLIIEDSVPCLIPEEVIEKRAGIASNSRLVSAKIPIVQALAKRHLTTIVFINQVRDKIGVLYGNKETTPGGHFLKHITMMRLEVRKVGWIKYAESVIGFKARIRTIKNKRFPPYKDAYIEIIFDHTAPSIEVLNSKKRKNKISVEPMKEGEQ